MTEGLLLACCHAVGAILLLDLRSQLSNFHFLRGATKLFASAAIQSFSFNLYYFFSFHAICHGPPPWTHVSRYYVAMYIVEEYLHGPCRK